MNKALYGSTKMDWATPLSVFEPLHEKYKFTLDVCASDTNHKLSRYYTKEDDGLTRSWRGHRCWMNPPYGTEIKSWVKKASEEARDAHTFVVGLLPSRTDTQWWHSYVIKCASSIHFVKGRIRFVGATASAPFPSAIITWGNP